MAEDFLPYGRQWIGEDDVEPVAETLRGDWLTTGPKVTEFEAELCRVGGTSAAVALNSGTAALHCAYAAAGVGPGDEVIVPALTLSATANAAMLLGAAVRFADIETEGLTIDVDSASRLITSRTKVLAAVAYAGHPVNYDRLRRLADESGILLVADACHSLGGVQGSSRGVAGRSDLFLVSPGQDL